MDMLPPQAPPAHVSVRQQASVDAIRRLSDAQSWLVDQHDQLPDPPVDAGSKDAYLDRIDQFWDTPVRWMTGQPMATRRDALARQLEQVARDDAAVRVEDGTLPTEAVDLLRSATMAGKKPDGDPVHAYELLFGRVAYAGALVLRDDRHPAVVLLFTTQGGWEAFDSLDTMYRDTERRMRQVLANDGILPGIGTREIDDAIDDAFLGVRALGGNVFDAIAGRLVEHHRQKIDESWDAAHDLDTVSRADLLHETGDLHALVDIHGIVLHRDAALLRHHRDDTLSTYPGDLADTWREASDAYLASRRRSALVQEGRDIATPLSLIEFARNALHERLRDLGVNEDPERIRVRRVPLPGAPSEALSSAEGAKDKPVTSLLQLSFDNVPGLPIDDLQILDDDGVTHPRLTPSVVRHAIRDIDLGPRYLRHIDEVLGDTLVGRQHRQLASDLYLTRMRLDAASATLKRHDALLSASRPSMEASGLRWVDVATRHPSARGRPRVDGRELTVQQLVYRGTALPGALVIAPKPGQASSGLVLYMPDAPDGITLRQFASREEMIENVLHQQRFEPYLLERLPASFATYGPGGSPRFAVSHPSRTWQWATGGTGHAFCTLLEEAFTYRDITDDLTDASYDAAVELTRLNTRHLTRSTTQADLGTVAWLLSPFGASGERTVQIGLATIQSIPHLAQASWRAYDGIKAGDYTQSFLDTVEGYVAALNVVPFRGAFSRDVAGKYLRTRAGSQGHGTALRMERLPGGGRSLLTPPRVAGTGRRPAHAAHLDGSASLRLRQVPEGEWPETAYYYATPAELREAHRTGVLMLPQQRLARDGVQGIPLLTLPPWTPLPGTTGIAGPWLPRAPAASTLTPAQAGGAWVRIELRKALHSVHLSDRRLTVYTLPTGPSSSLIVRPEAGPASAAGAPALTLLDHFSVHALSPL